MAHTPGPWHTQPSPHGGLILLRGDIHHHEQSHLQIVPEADARLIAAAPDLLEALRDMVLLFQGYQGMELKKANAAIAKACG